MKWRRVIEVKWRVKRNRKEIEKVNWSDGLHIRDGEKLNQRYIKSEDW